jgi:hypothetical protein
MEDLVATKQQLEARVAQLNEARSLLQDQAARLEQTSIGFSHKQVTNGTCGGIQAYHCQSVARGKCPASS